MLAYGTDGKLTPNPESGRDFLEEFLTVSNVSVIPLEDFSIFFLLIHHVRLVL